MDFELVGGITEIETIAAGRGIRDLARLRRLYGKGHWRKMKGAAMKRMASVKKSSSARSTSTKRRKPAVAERTFAVCVRNDGYEASLERNKIYTVLPDDEAERDGDVRVIDESGEDYLFSADRFVPIEVPSAVKASPRKDAHS
jgi:hypothetical protein